MRILLTVVCAGALLWAATPAEAQLFQRPGTAPAPAVQPAPGQPLVAQPSTPPPAPPQSPANIQAEPRIEGQGVVGAEGRMERRTEISGQADGFSARAGAAGGEAHGHTRIFRGSTLVGMTILGGENQQVGVVKDILFDPRGGCIQHVVLESPTIEQRWVVLPYDVFHMSFDAGQRHEHLVLDMPVDRLQHAPHIEVNQWERIHDPQFSIQMQQFSQRIERTTARPTREESLDVDSQTQQSGRAQTDIRTEQRTEDAMPERPPTGDLQTSSDSGLGDEVRKDAQQRTEMQRQQRQGAEPQTDRLDADDAQRRGETQRQARPGTGPQSDRPAAGQPGQGDRPSGSSRSPSPANQPQTGQSPAGQSQSGPPQTDRPQSGQPSGQPQSSNR